MADIIQFRLEKQGCEVGRGTVDHMARAVLFSRWYVATGEADTLYLSVPGMRFPRKFKYNQIMEYADQFKP